MNNTPSLEKLLSDLEVANNAIQKHGLAALKVRFLQFFEECPEIDEITWTQYTPYFNDGDACVFQVGEPDFDLEEGRVFSCEVEKKWEDMCDLFYRCSDIFEAAFGDHVQITATREGFDVSGYDHD